MNIGRHVRCESAYVFECVSVHVSDCDYVSE